MVRYLMELLSTLSHIEILNKASKYSGHVAIRMRPQKATQALWQALYEQEQVYCDYAPRYDLIRFGMGSLYTSFPEVHKLFEIIKRVSSESLSAALVAKL